MRRRTSVSLAGLFVALTACADASSTPVAPAAAPTALLGSYPSVAIECSQDSMYCMATASGGSGGGYSFEWSSNVTEQYDEDGYSWGDVNCYGYLGWRGVSVTVTDSYGATGGASASLYCSP